MKIAILDDYQGVATEIVDWAAVDGVEVVPFRDHIVDETALVARLQGFQGVMRIRERTEFQKAVINTLPELELILATGMRNARSLDLAATDARGITVYATDVHHTTTVDVVWLMLLALFRGLRQESQLLRAGGWQWGLGQPITSRDCTPRISITAYGARTGCAV